MPSSTEYVSFIEEQLSGLKISSKKMFGEYVLYCDGKVFGGIYDDRLLIKITSVSDKLIPEAEKVFPYDGGSLMYLVSDLDDADSLKELVYAVSLELPLPKPRKKKSPKYKP